jgi:hypothetical protein
MVNSFQEDVPYLKTWLEEAVRLGQDIASRSSIDKSLAVFTIGSTVKSTKDRRPFFSPIRKLTHGYCVGAVVFSQTQAVLCAHALDGIVDIILVDAEKKIEIQLGSTQDIFDSLGWEMATPTARTRTNIEMGNLSAACGPVIQKSIFQEYKANDLTVDSVWYQLSQHYRVLSGKKITIIGCGNIGFKLALKCVESGCHVEIVRRDLVRGMQMADLINQIKPQSTVACAQFNSNHLKASLFSDALIGCTNGVPAISWDMIQAMKPDGIVIDVGKGSIQSNAISASAAKNIPITRCDITTGIEGVLASSIKCRQIQQSKLGRREYRQGLFIVSGGYLGLNGDIVVNDFLQPTRVFGIANGEGDFKRSLTDNEENLLQQLKEEMK